MARLLITDVTVLKGADITAQIRFNGGTTHTLHLELPKQAWQLHQTPSAVVELVDQLLGDYTDVEVASQLNSTEPSCAEFASSTICKVNTSGCAHEAC